MRIAIRGSLVCAGLCCASLSAPAQEPAVNATVPAAVIPGQPLNVRLQGGNLAGAKGIWTSFAAQTALAVDVPENGTKADQVTFSITAASDVPVGIHGLRVWTDKGVSPLRFLLVDDLPTVAQAGNNTTPETAQVLSLPTAVDGAVGNLSVQYFKFPAAEGQTLSFEVLSRRIGSSLDPMIRILDARGRELAFSDDAAGLSGDSQISHKFAAAGDYLLELRDIRFQGGAYRLRIGDFPCATVAYPLAIQRGQTAPITLAGFAIDGVAPVSVTAPADPIVRWIPVSLKRTGGVSSGFSTLAVVDRPQFLEVEPNNAAEQANRVELSQDVNGRFEQAGDVDRFVFKAPKDASYVFTGVTRTQGSPSDLNIKVLKADGGQLGAVDDTGTEEGSVTIKFPEEADYTLVVEDLAKRGGPQHAYRIAIEPAVAKFDLAVSTDTFNVPAGGSIFATVTAKRINYGGPIELSVAGLPEGVTASKSVIGAGRNDAVITLTAGPAYQPGSMQLVQVIGVGAEPHQRTTADFATAIKPKFANMRFPPATLTSTLTTSAAAAPGFTWKAEPAEVVFGKQLATKTKLIAARGMGYDDVVAVTLQPPQNGLPPGIAVAVKNIDKGAGEVEIAITADDKAPLGEFTIGLLGTLKKDKETVVQPVALRLRLAAPLTTTAAAGEGKLAAGGELAVTVKIERNPALSGPVDVAFANLPAGVTAAAATIPADQTEATIKLTAAADAAKGAVNNVQVKTTATVNNVKFEAVSPNLALTVE